MRFITYERDGNVGVGIRVGDSVRETPYAEMTNLIKAGKKGLEEVKVASEKGNCIEEYRTLAPVLSPSKILFSGINYASHLGENPSATLPSTPQIFAKLPSAIIGSGENIIIPRASSKIDYEVELAVVIGRRTRGVSRDEALEYVFGYTVVNDVSARDVQFKDNQITTGKGFDTFCPMGPELVLRDEIPNPQDLVVSSYVNGERRQHSQTSEMLFDVGALIEFLSNHITLYPGDVISTGTPAGVGLFMDPPSYLKEGDVVDVEVDGIGRLTNPVVTE